jgi:peptidoglycan/xylan/chitin deacetylase (PgdA/CDA1 family)
MFMFSLYTVSLTSISYGQSIDPAKACNCVIFRMDDIQDYWLVSGQFSPMDVFLSKNQSLSLGLIMNDIGEDTRIIEKVKDGFYKNFFELALHGWNHSDYTKLTEQAQGKSLHDSNEKLFNIFGVKSEIFIPPENRFNNDTLKAMDQQGIKVLSSAFYAEEEFDGGKSIFNATSMTRDSVNGTANKQQKILHIPETISFNEYVQGEWVKNPLGSIIGNVTNNIDTYGYAVIVLHPQDFVKSENGTSVDLVDENEIKDLSTLIDDLASKNIPIASFSKLAGIQPSICIEGFDITGYFTPFESDYDRIDKVTVNVKEIGEKEFDKNFIEDVKMEGWGKTVEGWYIGIIHGEWVKSSKPLNAINQPLVQHSASAVDTDIIPHGTQFSVPTLKSPYNKAIFIANDVGGAVKGKHIDIYTGEGKQAEEETFVITGKNNTICHK